MSRNRRPSRFAALLVLVAPAVPAAAQDLPEPLPADRPGTAARATPAAVPAPPSVIPTPPVVLVPPDGPRPTWLPGMIDPLATAQHGPKHVDKKLRSCHWRRLQAKFFGYPEEYAPRPLGAALYDHGRAMVAQGAAARLVLFRYDFVDGTSQLNDRGRDQLVKAAAQLAVSPYPLIIERTPDDPALADARRYAVLAALAGGPTPVPSGRVLVGLPSPNGLSGADAQIIGANALNRTQQYGPPIPINSNGVNSPTGVTNSVIGTLPGQ